MTITSTTALRRTAPVPPVRQVHLGLGNFFRAHQAWYSDRAPDAAQWGIAAFAGRSAGLADQLRAQDGLYSLITRRPGGDDVDVVSALASVHTADDLAAWTAHLSSPDVSVVTLTVTEAGYRMRDGGLDHDDPLIARDVEALRQSGQAASCSTAVGRLVQGLLARAAADAGPLTVISCDNLPGNGAVLSRLVHDVAAMVSPALMAWIGTNASFPSTMVDRITPATTDEHRLLVSRIAGIDDAVPVLTEPFSEWVIEDRICAATPDWAGAGALITADVESYERRKLWLLNGAHSLLAYVGLGHGLLTVAEAMRHEETRSSLEAWWLLAQQRLDMSAYDLRSYMASLVTRFENPRMEHRLAQIAMDGSQKIPARILPLLRAEREDGRMPVPAVAALAAWITHLRRGEPRDPRLPELLTAVQGEDCAATRRVLTLIGADLADDDELVATIAAEIALRPWP